jgi:hypothetical protein
VTLKARYDDHLRNMPLPGQGRHGAALGIANLGIMAGVTPEEIHFDIRRAADLPDREVRAAILKAASDHGAPGPIYRPPPKPAPLVKDGQAALKRIIDQGTISDDCDLWEVSPIRLYDAPEHDAVLLLENLFNPGEHVFIGDRYADGIIGQSIRLVSEWIWFFQNGGQAGPFIIINPFTGEAAPVKDGSGKLTYRGDNSISAYRHCLVEFDTLSRGDQIRFWSAVKLPIRALIDTGGKSIHAWLEVSKLSTVSSAEAWDREIKNTLYEKIMVPLGVDPACCNPSRLSRLPGCLRDGKYQRLLWLSPSGREVVR